MTGPDRVVQLLTDFLEDAPERAPDQLLETILIDLQTAPQSAGWRAALARVPILRSSLVRYGALTGVVIFAATLAFSWWAGRSDRIGPPGDTPRPSPTVRGTNTPPPATRNPSPGALVPGRQLAPGTYAYEGEGVRVTLTVPAGWESNSEFSVAKIPAREGPDGTLLSFHQPDAVFDDPCNPEAGAQLVDTVDDLVIRLSELPHVDLTAPTDISLDGFPGTHLAWTTETEGIDCVMGLWQYGALTRAADTGQHDEAWILDVAASLVLVDATTFPETPASDRAELQAIIDSLTIEAIDQERQSGGQALRATIR